VISAQSPTAAPSTHLIFTSLLRADFIVFLKNRKSLILSILLPYLILVSTNSKKGTANLGGSLFVIGLSITYGIASTSIMGYSLAVARDREKGVLQRLRVTPASAWAIMGSRLFVQVLANLIVALAVVVLGARIHHLSLSLGQYGLALLISILGGTMFLCIGQTLVALIKSSETVNSTARLLYIGLLFFGLLGQGGSLGHTWGTVARWTPVGTVMTLFAGVLNLAAWNSRDVQFLLAAIGYIVAFAFIGIRGFQWEAR
jgi:ABC-2 type transport system permease protein